MVDSFKWKVSVPTERSAQRLNSLKNLLLFVRNNLKVSYLLGECF